MADQMHSMVFETTDFTILAEFPLGWRFRSPWGSIPPEHLAQIRPLSAAAAAGVASVGADRIPRLHGEMRTERTDHPPAVVHQFLLQLPVAADCAVVLSWDASTAVVTTWEIFVHHWDDFCYPASDDVTLAPLSGDWMVSYHHYEALQFRSSRPA